MIDAKITMVRGIQAVRVYKSERAKYEQLGYHKGTFYEVKQNKRRLLEESSFCDRAVKALKFVFKI